jgi:hypothetical protein
MSTVNQVTDQNVHRYFDDGRFADDLRRRVAWRTESDADGLPPRCATTSPTDRAVAGR